MLASSAYSAFSHPFRSSSASASSAAASIPHRRPRSTKSAFASSTASSQVTPAQIVSHWSSKYVYAADPSLASVTSVPSAYSYADSILDALSPRSHPPVYVRRRVHVEVMDDSVPARSSCVEELGVLKDQLSTFRQQRKKVSASATTSLGRASDSGDAEDPDREARYDYSDATEHVDPELVQPVLLDDAAEAEAEVEERSVSRGRSELSGNGSRPLHTRALTLVKEQHDAEDDDLVRALSRPSLNELESRTHSMRISV